MTSLTRYRRFISILLAFMMVFSNLIPGFAEVVATEAPLPPVEVNQTIDPATSEAPADPATSEAPADPATSEEPADPATSEEPADPATSESPADPATSEAPADPATSEAPADPATSEAPADPATSEAPADPATSEAPADPATSEAPADEPVVSEDPLPEPFVLTPEQEALIGQPLSPANFSMMRMLILENSLPDLYDIEIKYLESGTDATVAPSYLAIIEAGQAMTVASPQVLGYVALTDSVDVPATASLSTTVYYASTTYNYQVIHQQEQVGGGFVTVETQNLSGVQGNLTQALAKSYAGFVEYPIVQEIIPNNNDLVVTVRYWRVSYPITFDTGIEGSAVNAINKLFGEPLTTDILPTTPTRLGYTFGGWDWNGAAAGLGSLPSTMPANAMVATAVWTANTNTPFSVLYWVQNPDDDLYSPIALHTGGQGQTGALAPADYLSTSGAFPYATATGPSGSGSPSYSFSDLQTYFHTKSIEQMTISGDGSTVVNVYYDRNTYTFQMRTHVYRRASGTANYIERSDIHTYVSVPNIRYEANIKNHFLTLPPLEMITSHPGFNGNWITNPYYSFAYGKLYLYGTNDYESSFNYWVDYTGRQLMSPEFVLHKGIINLSNNTADFMASWRAGVAGWKRAAIYYYEKLDSTDPNNYGNYFYGGYDLLRGDWTEAAAPPMEGFSVKLPPLHPGWVDPNMSQVYIVTGDEIPYHYDENGNKVYADVDFAFTFHYKRNNVTLTYDFNGSGQADESITLKYEAPLPAAPEPTRAGYTFMGWFREQSPDFANVGSSAFTDTTMPAHDTRVFAGWQKQTVEQKLYLTAAETTPYETRVLPYGSVPSVPLPPTREGYIFKEWHNRADGTLYLPEALTQDSELEAVWITGSQVTYTVNYLLQSDNSVLKAPDTKTGTADTSVSASYVPIYGYVPVTTEAQSITLSYTGQNAINIYYVPVHLVPYNVRFLDQGRFNAGITLVLAPQETRLPAFDYSIYTATSNKVIDNYNRHNLVAMVRFDGDPTVNQAGNPYLMTFTYNPILKYVSADATHGSVSSDQEAVVSSGTPQGATATPADGYFFRDWTNASGTVVSTSPSYVPTVADTGATDGYLLPATFTANFIKDTTPPIAPVIDTIEAGATTVTGTGEIGATVTVTFPGGGTATAIVQENGTWTVTVPATENLVAGDIVKATQADAAGNISPEAQQTVVDTTAPLAPVIDAIEAGTTTVTGTGENGATVTVTFPGGGTATAIVQENGTWTVTVPATESLEDGDIVKATQADAAGNVSPEAQQTVEDTTPPSNATTTITFNNITDDNVLNAAEAAGAVSVSGTVTGEFSNGDSITLTVNGNTYTGTVNATGDFSIDVSGSDLSLDPDTKVEAVLVATDASGNQGNVTGEASYTLDTTVPGAPDINPIEPGATEITGTGENGATVIITYPDGSTQEVPVDENGNWTAVVPENITLAEGDIVSATQTDGAGNVSDPGTETVHDTIPPIAPVIDAIEAGTTTVTGTGENGATVTVTFPDGGTATAIVQENGTWTVTVPATESLEDGDIVTATQADAAGNVSPEAQQTVEDTTPPSNATTTITFNNITDDNVLNAAEAAGAVSVSGTVTGEFSNGDSITLTVNGNTYTGTVNATGDFSIDVSGSDLSLDPDTKVEAVLVATDASGNQGDVTGEASYTLDTTVPGAPDINPIEPGATEITGTGENGATVIVTFPDGSTATAIVQENGTWTVPVPNEVTLAEGDIVSATQTDGAGNVSDPGTETVHDTIPPIAPVIDAIEAGTTTVTGTGENGATVTVTFPDGETATAIVQENGTWTVTVPATESLEDGDIVTATQADAAGNVSPEAQQTVEDNTPPSNATTSIKFNNITDDNVLNAAEAAGAVSVSGTVTGEFTNGDSITLTVNGNTYTGTVNATGDFSIDVPGSDLSLDPDTKVEAVLVATDASGNQGNVTGEASYTLDTTVPGAPDINPIEPGATEITGTGEIGATVTVTFPGGGTATAIVQENGTWTVTVPATENLVAGDIVKATQADVAGNISPEAQQTVVDTTAPLAPVIDAIEAGTTTVTGTGENGATVTVTFPGGETATAIVQENGTWTVTVPATESLEDGDIVTATQADAAGNVSPEAQQTVEDTTPPSNATTTITFNNITDDNVLNAAEAAGAVSVSGTVTGEFSNGDSITLTVNGNTYTGTVNATGDFSIDVPGSDLSLDPDTKVEAVLVATDASGNQGNVTGEASYTLDTTVPGAPDINPIEPGATEITGTGENGATVIITYPDGSTQEVPVDENGNWTAVVPEDITLAEGDVVSATQTDGAGNVSDPGTETVHDTIPPIAPVIDAIEAGATTVTGTGENGATVTVTFPGGGTATAIVQENGTWTVTVPATESLEDGDIVKATQADAAGNVSPEAQQTVEDTTPPSNATTSIKFNNITDDNVLNAAEAAGAVSVSGTVTGEFSNGDSITLTVNGNTYTGTVNATGDFSIDVSGSDLSLDPDTKVEAVLVATDASGNQGNVTGEASYTLDTTVPGAPDINPIEPGATEITGTGENGATVIITYPDGSTQEVPVDENGNWTAVVPENITLAEGDIVSATQTDGAGNVSDPGTETVHDTTAPLAPVIDAIEAGATTVTGTGENGATVTVTFPGGETATAIVQENGTWTVTVPIDVTLVDGNEVSATQTDSAGNTGDPATEIVHDTTAPDAPVVNPVEPGDIEITGTGEPGATVVITYPDGSTQEVPVDEEGNWTAEVPEDITLEEGDVIPVTQTDEADNTSEATEVTVTDTTAPDAPVVNPVEPGDTEITGTGEPGATVVITYPDGSTQEVPVDEDGNWTAEVPEDITLEEGDEITVTQTDEAGNTSEGTEVTVTDTTAPDAPVVNPVEPGDTEITGTGEPGATVVITYPDGSTQEVPVDEDGNWTAEVPEDVTLEEGDEITVTQTDEAGNTSEATEVTVTDTTAPDAPVVNPVEPGDTEITGTGEPGATVVITYPDGSTQEVPVDEDGNWTAEVPEDVTLEEGDEITVTQTDEAGNSSENTVVTVNVPAAPALPSPLMHAAITGSEYLSGTGIPLASVKITVEAETVYTTTVNEDGNWYLGNLPALVEGNCIRLVMTTVDGQTAPEIMTFVQ